MSPRGWNSSLRVGAPLERRTTLRSGRGNPRSVERRARDFARKYHSLERVLFVKHALICCVPFCHRRPCMNAHVLGGEGMGRKAGYLTVAPLCWLHESSAGVKDSFHNLGSRAAFERAHGIDLRLACQRTEESWERHGPLWIANAKADGRWERMLAA